MLHRRKNRLIRIFISSTFIDMSVERTLLQSKIVPEVKRYCNSKGWQFECIDLRWGVSQEAQESKKTIEICLNEIRHCRLVSPKPNFLILLGQRYGWVPDASYIPKTEYEDMLHSVGHSISATELEIYEGLLSQDYLSANTILYDRVLSDVPSNEVENYIENKSAEEIKDLKKKIRDFISGKNIIEENISFGTYIGEDYQNKFVSQMTSMLKSLVDKEIKECIDMDDYKIESLFQEEILASHVKGKHSDIIARIESSKSRIVVVKSTDESQRLGVLSEYTSSHSDSAFFRTLGRSWMSSDGIGYLRSFLKTQEVKFFLSDTFNKSVERLRDIVKFPDSYNVKFPKHIVIDSIDNLHIEDPLLYFTWFAPSLCDSKILLSLSDLEYLKHLYPSDYEVIDLESTTCYQYSDFAKALDYICRPENNNITFVKLAIGLICYSHSGVTEDEILEMSAMDESYYKELTEKSAHDLPVFENALPRIPYSIWSILYYHLGSMLVVRNSLGATTFVFDNDNYRDYAIRYFEAKNKESSYKLIIKYFNTPEAFKTTRALEELPNAYIATEAYRELYSLIQDCSFCQRLAEHGLGEKLFEYVRILQRIFTEDREVQKYLEGMSDFLTREMDALCKYAKFDKSFFKKKLTGYLAKDKDSRLYPYRQKAIFLRSCTSASRIQDNKALIVSYEENGDSLCEIIDLKTESLIAMRYVKVDVIEKGNGLYPGALEKSYINGNIIYLYDRHWFMNTWNFLTNEFSRVETGHLEKIPQDNTPEFTLPEDFNLGSNEHIIASGKVDEKSFYVVTCQSLRLITKEK
jgi:hypothetical protein